MTTTTALALADQVWARLQTTVNVNMYDGEIVDDDGNETSPPVDDDGRVHAYVVYYPGPGVARGRMLDQGPDELAWTFQVTCVGGDRTSLLWAVGQVRARLHGFRVTNAHGQALVLTEVGDPGPIRRDTDVTPARLYVPLLFTVTA